MPKISLIKESTIVAGGATLEYRIADPYDAYRIIGGAGANLTGGYTVRQDAADATPSGLTYNIKYEADVVYTGGNVITVFGRALTAAEARKELWITAIYRNAAWEVDVQYDAEAGTVALADLGTDIYADDSTVLTGSNDTKLFTSLKLKNWWTATKLLAQSFGNTLGITGAVTLTAQTASKWLTVDASKVITGVDIYEVIVLKISFETGYQTNNFFDVPYGFTITSAKGRVSKVIAGTDNATIQLKIAATNVTDGLLTFPLSSALETAVTVTPSAANVGTAGQTVACTAAKTTAGGEVLLTITLKRTVA